MDKNKGKKKVNPSPIYIIVMSIISEGYAVDFYKILIQ